jgi:hypothetical protein
MDARVRNDIADRLEGLASQPMWNPDLCQQCLELVGADSENALLDFVYDQLLYHSGLHSGSILGFRVRPDRFQLERYRRVFRDIAAALRSGLSLTEAKKRYDL